MEIRHHFMMQQFQNQSDGEYASRSNHGASEHERAAAGRPAEAPQAALPGQTANAANQIAATSHAGGPGAQIAAPAPGQQGLYNPAISEAEHTTPGSVHGRRRPAEHRAQRTGDKGIYDGAVPAPLEKAPVRLQSRRSADRTRSRQPRVSDISALLSRKCALRVSA
jgi:hypothetical protein